MKKDPSNTLLLVVGGIVLILAIYALGSFIIKGRREFRDDPEANRLHPQLSLPDVAANLE